MAFQDRTRGPPKNKITAYPNFFHAVRTLTDFEYQGIPVNMKKKKNRLEKLRKLAVDLGNLLRSDHQLVVSSGRVEVSLQGVDVQTDVMRQCQKIALSQFKCLSMKLVPIADILQDLDAVAGFEDSVGSDDLVLTPEDQAELAILSNMCGLWSWKFKPHLDKSLDSLQVVDASLSVEGVPVSPFPLFASLDFAERNTMLVWYVGVHPRSSTKFTYRTFTTKGGMMRGKKALLSRKEALTLPRQRPKTCWNWLYNWRFGHHHPARIGDAGAISTTFAAAKRPEFFQCQLKWANRLELPYALKLRKLPSNPM